MIRLEEINERKHCFISQKINKMTKTLVRLIKIQYKERRHKLPISGMNQYIITNLTFIKSIRKHCKTLYDSTFYN